MKTLGLILICSALFTIALSQDKEKKKTKPLSPIYPTNPEFSEYWNQGLAEITTYELLQERYGEIHKGIANTIFVTEPFSLSKQVKLDNPSSNLADKMDVLKLNMTRKFNTGVYPYSTMLSIFTPQDLNTHPHSPKASFSAQEWCGQTYSQVNLEKNGYQLEERSYFESRGDNSRLLKKTALEHEIFNTIRINPDLLPTGSFEIIPSLGYTQLYHQSAEAVMTSAELENDGETSIYTLTYPHNERVLRIYFESAFPHLIEHWEEEDYTVGRKKMKTTATVKARKMLDYWNKHSLKDTPLRLELGLE